MGSSEQIIVGMAVRTGQPIPDRIRFKPKLLPGLDLYLQAFYALDSERPIGMMSPGRIPWSKVYQYASVYKFSPEQFDDLTFYISALDEAHLDRIRAMSKE